jgi:hypothetical protein
VNEDICFAGANVVTVYVSATSEAIDELIFKRDDRVQIGKRVASELEHEQVTFTHVPPNEQS